MNLNQEQPLKSLFFWLKSYKIEVMITPMKCWSYQTLATWPQLQPNLSQVIKFCLWCLTKMLWRHELYFKMISRKLKADISAYIMKIAITKCLFYLCHIISQKLLAPGKKCSLQQNSRDFSCDLYNLYLYSCMYINAIF